MQIEKSASSSSLPTEGGFFSKPSRIKNFVSEVISKNYSFHLWRLLIQDKGNFRELKQALKPNKILEKILYLIPTILAIWFSSPWSGDFFYFWDQNIILNDKSLFFNGFHLFDGRFGFGLYGYFLILPLYSIFQGMTSNLPLGFTLQAIFIFNSAFFGIYFLIKQLTFDLTGKNLPKFKILAFVLGLLYLTNWDTLLNVLQIQLAQNYFWAFMHLYLYFWQKYLRFGKNLNLFFLLLTTFQLIISFAHPSQVLNFIFLNLVITGYTLFYQKLDFTRFIKASAVTFFAALPIFTQMLLSYQAISGAIYSSDTLSGDAGIRAWFLNDIARFSLPAILSLSYQWKAYIFNPNSNWSELVNDLETKSYVFAQKYFWLPWVNYLLILPVLYFILSPLVSKKTNLFIFNSTQKEQLSLTKKLNLKNTNLNSLDLEQNKNNLEIKNSGKAIKKLGPAYYLTFFWFICLGFLASFSGPLLDFWNILFRFVPNIFLFYRFLDHKFGITYLIVYFLLIATSFALIKNQKLQKTFLGIITLVSVLNTFVFWQKDYLSSYSRTTIPDEYNQVCNYLKNNSTRTIKYPYSLEYLQILELKSGQKQVSNDLFVSNCNHPVLVQRLVNTVADREINELYQNLVTKPEVFLNKAPIYGIDTLLIEKTFVPNARFYDSATQQEKDQVLGLLEKNYKDKLVFNGEKLLVYQFTKTPIFEMFDLSKNQDIIEGARNSVSQNFEIQKLSPTKYRLDIKLLSNQKDLVFKTTFADWQAKVLYPDKSYKILPHYKAFNYANGWSLDSIFCPDCNTENLIIEIELKPQKVFLYVTIISLLAIVFILTSDFLFIPKSHKINFLKNSTKVSTNHISKEIKNSNQKKKIHLFK